MMEKKRVFSKTEFDIILRGREGKLQNLEEMKFYLNYLQSFKDDCIEDLIKNFHQKNFAWEYIGGVCLCGLGGGFFGLVSLLCGSIPSAIFWGIIVLIGIIAPGVNNSLKAKNIYLSELAELIEVIKEEEKKENQRQKDLDEKRQKERDEFLKQDGFLVDIVNDIARIENVTYAGCERDILALKSLGIKYLAMKKKLQVVNSTEVLSKYPVFQTIILGIEAKIEAGILFAESEKRDRAILRGKINDMTELMSDEELIKYIPSKEITLELK